MSTSLHDRLADLAGLVDDTAPPGGPDPDIWGRATRYHRRRRAGTVVIAAAAVLALLAVAGLNWFQARPDVQPAGGRDGLPDRVYHPSKWLPAASPGRLSLAFADDRGSLFGTERSVVGVSASTGEYGFIDLPGMVGAWSLAPDGRHVAYWQTGPTTGAANDELLGTHTSGIAIYDTTTGEVRSHPIETEHGLAPGALAWTDAQTVVLSYGQMIGGPGDSDMDQSSSTDEEWFLWELDEDGPSELELPKAVVGGTSGGGVDGVLTIRQSDGSDWFVDPHDPASARPVFHDGETTGQYGPVIELNGERIAGVGGGEFAGNPNRIALAPSAQPSSKQNRVPLRPIVGTRGTWEVLAWPDDELVVERMQGRDYEQTVLARVDPETGEATTMVTLPRTMGARTIQYASDLFTAPTVEGIEPPAPMGPRTTLVLVLLATGAASVALLWWRRRVRP